MRFFSDSLGDPFNNLIFWPGIVFKLIVFLYLRIGPLQDFSLVAFLARFE